VSGPLRFGPGQNNQNSKNSKTFKAKQLKDGLPLGLLDLNSPCPEPSRSYGPRSERPCFSKRVETRRRAESREPDPNPKLPDYLKSGRCKGPGLCESRSGEQMLETQSQTSKLAWLSCAETMVTMDRKTSLAKQGSIRLDFKWSRENMTGSARH